MLILDLQGKLITGSGDIELRTKIQDALRAGERQILINMQGVRMMDSSGLGELVRAKQAANSAGATIKLLHVEDKVCQILEMAHLIGVFDTFDDEIDAIASFRS